MVHKLANNPSLKSGMGAGSVEQTGNARNGQRRRVSSVSDRRSIVIKEKAADPVWVESSLSCPPASHEKKTVRHIRCIQCKCVRADKRKSRGRYSAGDHSVLATPGRLTRASHLKSLKYASPTSEFELVCYRC